MFSISDNEEVVNGFFQYRFDNGVLFNNTGIPHNFRIDPIPQDAKILHYRAGIMDSDGNWMIIEKAQEIMDGTPPSIELHADIPYTSRTLKVTINAVDNREIWDIKVAYSVNDDSARLPALLSGEHYEVEVPEDAVKITLYGSASDGMRNDNETTIVLDVLDGTPPEIDHRETKITTDGTIVVSFLCTDGRELGEFWIMVKGDDGRIHNFTGAGNDGDVQFIAISTKGLGNEIRYRIYAADGSGNLAVSDEMSFTIDVEQENTNNIFLWILLIVILFIVAFAAASGALLISRSRRQVDGPRHEEIMKLKEVFEHFDVGTRKEEMDCYVILDVPRSATKYEIVKRYRELAVVHHPDRNGSGSSSDDTPMKRINCAKTILLDPEKRTILDLYLGPPSI